jgi:hypothetical protein
MVASMVIILASIESLSIKTQYGFRAIHNYGVDRVNHLHNASIELNDCSSTSETLQSAHGIYFDGMYAIATVSHSKCIYNSSFIVHPKEDLTLLSRCPDYAIDATHHFHLRIGDDIVVYGYGKQFSYYRGYVNNLKVNIFRLFPHLQFSGMSGSAALNGCGYCGMLTANIAHYFATTSTTNSKEQVVSEAQGIKASVIKQFMLDNRAHLKNSEDCQHITKIIPNSFLANSYLCGPLQIPKLKNFHIDF